MPIHDSTKRAEWADERACSGPTKSDITNTRIRVRVLPFPNVTQLTEYGCLHMWCHIPHDGGNDVINQLRSNGDA